MVDISDFYAPQLFIHDHPKETSLYTYYTHGRYKKKSTTLTDSRTRNLIRKRYVMCGVSVKYTYICRMWNRTLQSLPW